MSKYPDLYPYSAEEARRLNELDQWRESYRANNACKKAIEGAIAKDFDGMHLKVGCAKGVIQEFGFQRVRFVLANTLKEKSYDGRFSIRNKEWFGQTFVPPDKDHNSSFVVDSHPFVLNGFMDEFLQAYQALGLFDHKHCIQEDGGVDYEGKIIILDPSSLKDECLSPENQLWLAERGIGCSPTASGRAVYATCLADGERVRWDRSQFLGAANEELLPAWAKEQAEKLRSGQQISTVSAPVDGPIHGMTQSM